MTTTTLQMKLERSRFVGLAKAAIASFLTPARGRGATERLTLAEMAAREAQDVREMAEGYAKTDPGFAADLFAAAARHESLSER